MIFGSDNMAGASARVLDAIAAANAGGETSYGWDSWSERARAMLREAFAHDLAASFVATGTAANSIALSLLVQPWDAVLCHHQAHIANDEGTGPELFTGGARLVPLPGDGKLTPTTVERALARMPAHPPHNAVPTALSLTQSTELGLVYTVDEVAALCRVAHARGMRVHMDGARFANAVAATGASPADLTWRAGVDVLTLGATKGGALAAESVIVFDPALAVTLDVRVKRAGQMVSKGRLFGAQFVGWLDGGHWLDLARAANASAARLSAALARTPGARLAWPTEANEVFVVLPAETASRLEAAGVVFGDWAEGGLAGDLSEGERFCRFVASFATTEAELRQFEHALGSAVAEAA